MEHIDRDVPPPPKAVIADGVRYEEAADGRAHGFAQSGGVIVATDVKTRSERWAVRVYEVQFDPAEERDVQEIFITKLKMDADGKHLLVTREDGARFAVDVRTRAVSAVAAR